MQECNESWILCIEKLAVAVYFVVIYFSIVFKGLLHAFSIRHLVTTVMNLHISLQKSMTKTSALALCRLVELLKAVECTFHRRSTLLAETFNLVVQNLTQKAFGIVNTAKVCHCHCICCKTNCNGSLFTCINPVGLWQHYIAKPSYIISMSGCNCWNCISHIPAL